MDELMLFGAVRQNAPNHTKCVRKQLKIVPIPSKIVPGSLPEPLEDPKTAACWASLDLGALFWTLKRPKSVPKCPRSVPRRSKRLAKLKKHRLQKHICQWRCSCYDFADDFQWFQPFPNKKNLDFCWQAQCFEHFSKKTHFLQKFGFGRILAAWNASKIAPGRP